MHALKKGGWSESTIYHRKAAPPGGSATVIMKLVQPLVSICVVTWNHAKCIGECIQSILAQTYHHTELILVDNASRDETGKILSRYKHHATVVFNAENRGYCGGHNQAISMSHGHFVLLVNPDVVLKPDYLENAIRSICQNPKIGALCGLLLLGDENEPDCRVDGTGACISSSRRMYLRDHGVRLRDLNRQAGEVFGVDGSLPLYRQEMIEDVSIEGEFFDEMFFAHKEAWDVSWRARLLGWKAHFDPKCTAVHKHNFRPGNLSLRKRQSRSVKMHSVKNDMITIIKNEDISTGLRDLILIGARQLAIFAYVLLLERTSLPAYSWVLVNMRSIILKRKLIKAKQRIGGREAVRNP
jgi:GT2 family glycosyltransferase